MADFTRFSSITRIVKARLPAELVEIFHRFYGGAVIHGHSCFDGLGACGQSAGRQKSQRKAQDQKEGKDAFFHRGHLSFLIL